MQTYEKFAHSYSQGGCWILRIHGEEFDKGRGKFRGVETPVGAMGHLKNILFYFMVIF